MRCTPNQITPLRPDELERDRDYIQKHWNKEIDAHTYNILLNVPFNWHLILHLKGGHYKDAIQRDFLNDIGVIQSYIKRLCRDNPVIAFEDASYNWKQHIHALIRIPTDKEFLFFSNLKTNLLRLSKNKTYHIFKNIPLICDKRSLLEPVKDTKCALDYIGRKNLPANSIIYKSRKLEPNNRGVIDSLLTSNNDITFYKKNPYAYMFRKGYNRNAPRENREGTYDTTEDWNDLRGLELAW